MNIILFDNNREDFYPLSYTRPISHFIIGILTIKQKWEKFYSSVSVKTVDYLSEKFTTNVIEDNIWIDSTIIPSDELIKEIDNLRFGEGLVKQGKVIIFRSSKFEYGNINLIESHAVFKQIYYLSDIFKFNCDEITNDFNLIFFSKSVKFKSHDFNSTFELNNITKIGENPIYVHNDAKLQSCILNSKDGPIYIGRNSEIMEGAIIRGPFAMLDNSVLKMGARVYKGTTIGPFSKVGGEVSNTVFFGYSSKSHDGYIGNSVIGEWCNLGAGTNVSNLKNNYEEVKIWNYNTMSFVKTGLQFCGLIMGDHSKCGINTMFNTGTVVGVYSNIFGAGYPRNYIPSFSWGGSSGFIVYRLSRAFEVAKKVQARRNKSFDTLDQSILETVFNITKKFRKQY